MVVSRSGVFEKRFQEAITWRRWCQYRQRLWIPIYSIYWFFVKNHRWISVQAQMVFEIGEELGRGKWWKPKSSISGLTVNDIVHEFRSRWWKKMYMTFWQAKSTLLATLVLLLEWKKTRQGQQETCPWHTSNQRKRKQVGVDYHCENFIIGNLGAQPVA